MFVAGARDVHRVCHADQVFGLQDGQRRSAAGQVNVDRMRNRIAVRVGRAVTPGGLEPSRLERDQQRGAVTLAIVQ